MNTVSQSSNRQTKKLLPRQGIIDIEDDPSVSDHSHQLRIVRDATHNKGFTCVEETSGEVKKLEKVLVLTFLASISENHWTMRQTASMVSYSNIFLCFRVFACFINRPVLTKFLVDILAP